MNTTTTTNSIVVPLASIDETETDDEDQFYSAQQPPEVSSASASSSGANSFIYKFSDLTSLSSVYSSSSGHTITSPVPPTFSHQFPSQHSRQPSTSSTFSSSQYQYNHSFIVSPSTSDYFDDQTPTTSLSTTLAMIDAANRNSTSSSTAIAQDDEYCHDTGFFSSSMSSSSKRSSIDDISGTILAQHHHHYRPHHHTSQHQTSSLSNNFYSMDSSMNNQIDESSDDDDEDDPDKLLIGDLILDNANIDTSNVLKNVEEQQQQQSQTQLAKSKLSNSLQDLVNSFDEKVKSCLRNYEENVSSLAPVQIRSPEEVIKDRPAWWTLTGNYGNILPIDWTKLTPTTDGTIIDHRDNVCLSSDDEIMMDDVDVDEEIYDDEAEDEKLKHLISSCLELNYNRTPMKTADEVLKEIDAIIDAASSNGTGGSSTNCSASSVNSFQGRPVTSRSQHQQLHHRPLSHSSVRNSRSSRSSSLSSSVSGCYDSSSMYDVPIIKRLSFYPFALDKLKSFNLDQLQDLYEDLDHKVQKHSELLVKELATRDELEFEKEVKNTFLSLLILIQNRHRIEQKNRTVDERQRNNKDQINSVRRRKQLQFLTTVIPYQKNVTSNSVPTLQALIKILKAMNDDSPAVPNLLTDYILTYVCPTSNTGLSSLGPQNSQQQQKSAVNYLNSKISALSMMTSSATTGSYSKLKAAARLSFSSFSNQSQSKPTSEQHDNDVSINMTRASETSNDNNNCSSNFDEDYLNDSLNNNNNGDNVDIATITTTAHHDYDNVNGKQVSSNNLQTNRSKFQFDSNAIVA